MKIFEKESLNKLFTPKKTTRNGQVTIIGGSKLFSGAPLLSLKVASRISDMVFFASPEPSLGTIADHIKPKLFSFIWIPWKDVGAYIRKSDAILIGPGFMRYGSEQTPEEKRNYNYHEEGRVSRKITKELFTEYPNKHWVVDAGSLQVIDPELLPKGCVITPNKKEYQLLFKNMKPKDAAKKYDCIINAKGPTNIVCSAKECIEIPGGNPGLTKGGVGDVLAGLTVALLARNEAFLAATAASFITKTASDKLFQKVGPNYNADDLAEKIPEVFHQLTG